MGRYAAFVACVLIASISLPHADSTPAAAVPAPRSPELDRQTLLQLESRIAKAQLERDFRFLDAVLDGGMIYISADGRKARKQEYLDQLKNNRVYSQYLSKDVEVRTFGDIAVADGTQKVAGVFDGTKTSGAFVSSKVWAYRAGRWQIVRWQSTRAPPPTPEMLLKKLQAR